MLLGVIPMFCFGILRIFGGNRKKRKGGKSGHYRAPTPRRGIPSPIRGRGAKMAPLGYATA